MQSKSNLYPGPSFLFAPSLPRALNKGGANKNEGPGYKFDLDCMFSDECDKEPQAKSYLIKLNEADSGTFVSMVNLDGTKNNSPTADSILNILYDYLK